MKKRELTGPEALLANIGKSIMFRATVLSIILHAALTAGTSISLVQDWMFFKETKNDKGEVVREYPYLLKAPGTINAMKGAERKAAEEAKRKAEAAAKAEAEAKAAEAKKAAAEKAEKEAKAKAAADGAQPAAGGAQAGGEKKPPEVQPLPPKKEFELGDDLSLD